MRRDVDTVRVSRDGWGCRGGRLGGRFPLRELRPLLEELALVEAVAGCPRAALSVRVRGVAGGAGLLAGLVAALPVYVASLGDPRLRLKRVVTVLDDHDDVADATFIRCAEDDVTHPETAVRRQVLVGPVDLLEPAGFHTGAEVTRPKIVDLEQRLMSPRHAIGVVEAVGD